MWKPAQLQTRWEAAAHVKLQVTKSLKAPHPCCYDLIILDHISHSSVSMDSVKDVQEVHASSSSSSSEEAIPYVDEGGGDEE